MSEETVVYWGAIEVSKEDAILLDQDAFLYGNCYVEVFETGPGRRIAPNRVGVDFEMISQGDVLGVIRAKEE